MAEDVNRETREDKMKVLYWRWQNETYKPINRGYIQKENDFMFEVKDSPIFTDYPTRLLKSEILVIRIEDGE